jgi:hypothetical protein
VPRRLRARVPVAKNHKLEKGFAGDTNRWSETELTSRISAVLTPDSSSTYADWAAKDPASVTSIPGGVGVRRRVVELTEASAWSGVKLTAPIAAARTHPDR